MPKYLVMASYTTEGTKGLIKGGGGSARRAAIQQMMQGLGGRVEAFYYAFGDNDVYAIVDGPDNVTAAAVSLVINAAGGATTKTVVLLTPEEMDQAAKKMVNYRAPGQYCRANTKQRWRHRRRSAYSALLRSTTPSASGSHGRRRSKLTWRSVSTDRPGSGVA